VSGIAAHRFACQRFCHALSPRTSRELYDSFLVLPLTVLLFSLLVSRDVREVLVGGLLAELAKRLLRIKVDEMGKGGLQNRRS
jgi:hypothetical protein